MRKVVVVYHSGYGHTKKQAEAVHAGAASVGAAELIAIDAEGKLGDVGWKSLDTADAIIFGSPTYMGSVTWQFKKFADASSERWGTQAWKNKVAAGFTNSASMDGDKSSTLHYLITLALQHGMIWVGNGTPPAHTKAAQRNDLNWLGSSIGAVAQSPADASPDEGPLPGDLETAKLFGKRVAETVLRFK